MDLVAQDHHPELRRTLDLAARPRTDRSVQGDDQEALDAGLLEQLLPMLYHHIVGARDDRRPPLLRRQHLDHDLGLAGAARTHHDKRALLEEVLAKHLL